MTIRGPMQVVSQWLDLKVKVVGGGVSAARGRCAGLGGRWRHDGSSSSGCARPASQRDSAHEGAQEYGPSRAQGAAVHQALIWRESFTDPSQALLVVVELSPAASGASSCLPSGATWVYVFMLHTVMR